MSRTVTKIDDKLKNDLKQIIGMELWKARNRLNNVVDSVGNEIALRIIDKNNEIVQEIDCNEIIEEHEFLSSYKYMPVINVYVEDDYYCDDDIDVDEDDETEMQDIVIKPLIVIVV